MSLDKINKHGKYRQYVSTRNYFLAEKWGIAANGLRLAAVGDFGALHCQPSRNFDRSTKLDLTTEPPLLGRCCYGLVFLRLIAFPIG
jgi:hypothetical protein